MSDRRSAVFLEEMGVGPQWRLRNRAVSADAAAATAAGDVESAYAPPSAPVTPVQGAAPHATPVAQQSAPDAPPAARMQRGPLGADDATANAPAAAQHSSAAPHASASARPAPTAGQNPAGDEHLNGAPQTAGQQPSAEPQRASGNVQSPAAAAAAAARGASAAPIAPARVPGTPSIASTGEDMSWFDDAPTPEYKPQRKKVAAPEEPSAAQPQRPAPAAPAAPPSRAAQFGQAAPAARPPAQPRAGGMPQRAANMQPPSAMGYDVPAYDDIPLDEPPSWFDDDQPAAPAKAPASARSGEPASRGAEAASGHTASPGQPSDEQIAQMDWPALQAAVASCTRCGRCETRRQAIPGRGDEQATWIALDTAPGQAEDTEGYQFAGDPGYLLDNMLKAVGQTTEKGAYLTSLVKCHAPTAPSAEELQACRPYLQRELELTQAKVIVAFGHTTGKGLLGAAARGRIMLHGSVPVVATYHPADLLKKPEEKAKAWQDLCLAKAAHAGRR